MRLLIIQLNKKKREYKKSCQRIPEKQSPCQKEHKAYHRTRTDTVVFHLKLTLSINIQKYMFVSLCYTGQGN